MGVLSPFVNNKFCLKADESKTLDFGKVEVRATGIDLGRRSSPKLQDASCHDQGWYLEKYRR